MRYPLAIIFFIFGFVSSYGQTVELGTGYIFAAPRGTMKQNINYSNGFNIDFYFTPKEKMYSFGMELDVNMYGHDKTRENFDLADGTSAPMDMVVDNTFTNLMATGRYFLMKGKIRPFITGKLGYSFFNTDLGIYDPDDKDHCSPVDTKVLHKDGAVIFTAGVGLRWELLPKKHPGLLFLNLSANYTGGGKVSYMNVDAPSHTHSTQTTTQTSDVYARFVNNQTQDVHEHKVATIYSSPIDLIDYRAGVAVRLGRK